MIGYCSWQSIGNEGLEVHFGRKSRGSLKDRIANLAHLLWVEVLDLLLILEKLLHAPHLLHHPTELLELV